MADRARELDYVEFIRPVGGWDAGTRGTVVTEFPETALVEVSTESRTDADGLPARDLRDDLVSVPYAALSIVESAPTTAK